MTAAAPSPRRCGKTRDRSAAGAESFREPVSAELKLVERELLRLLPNGGGLIDEVCDHVLSTTGKRLRPALLLLTAGMAGEPSQEESVTAAAIVELVHTATLIHDDAIDGSSTRRGEYTVNRRWDNTVSILMGDYVYSKVFNLLADMKMFGAMGVLAKSTNEMTVAEMAQVEQRNNMEVSEADYMSVVDGKTASLIAAACEIGAMVAGGHDGLARICSQFGRRIGTAFQIVDDILDYIGDERILGKARGTDLKEGKVTLPLIEALKNARRHDSSRLRELAAAYSVGPTAVGPGDERGLEEIVSLIERYRGFKHSQDKAASFAESAGTLLLRFDDSPFREALMAATDYIVQRSTVRN